MQILVVRNDKLGDFILAWPALALIHHYRPGWRITALVPAYTAPLAKLCPWIDDIIIDEGDAATALARKLRRQGFAAQLTLFSTLRVALAGWLARIPYRLAPATKAAQLLYTQRLTQRRSRSEKPEYAYNLDLAYRLLADLSGAAPHMTAESADDFLPRELARPLLSVASEKIPDRAAFCTLHHLPGDRPLVFIHPGSGGSANNLSPAQYAELARRLNRLTPLSFVITAGPREQAIAQELSRQLDAPHAILDSKGNLESLIAHLMLADLFISNSTGPMHLAGALDRPTATFFPRHRSATPLRWQPLNAPAKRLAFTPPPEAAAEDVSTIDIGNAANTIFHKFFS